MLRTWPFRPAVAPKRTSRICDRLYPKRSAASSRGLVGADTMPGLEPRGGHAAAGISRRSERRGGSMAARGATVGYVL